MTYTRQELKTAINTLENPGEHIKHVQLKGHDKEMLTYSADLVRAFEIALEIMEEKKNDI